MINIRILTVLVVAFLFVGWGSHPRESKSDDFSEWIKKMETKHPNLKRIDPEELEAWLSDSSREQPLILDVRELEEYEVSHLRGARQIDPQSSPELELSHISKNYPIVTYCSVGYRSGKYAKKLERLGFQNVFELRGSIFGWANEGYSVFRAGELVNVVHPYDEYWGRYLNDQLNSKLTDNSMVE